MGKTVRRIAFDMAAFMKRAMTAGVDRENGRVIKFNDRDFQLNSAEWGYDLCVSLMLKAMATDGGYTPHQAILVFEGMNTKARRTAIDPTYKSGGDSWPPEFYEELKKLSDLLRQVWRDAGAIAVSQNTVEGDDVLAYLAHNTESPLLIATYDNDMVALNGCNPKAEVWTWVDGQLAFNKYGNWDYKLITLYKALVGDKNDAIKGCVGFGEKAWEKLLADYGEDGALQLLERLEAGSLGDEIHSLRDESKEIAKICDQEAHVLRQYQLARLHPEWCDTLNRPLLWVPGKVVPADHDMVEESFAERGWYGFSTLVTTDNWEVMSNFFEAKLEESPFVALDIESSTPPESDEWLAAQPKAKDTDGGIDVLGQKLTGLSLTFGNNLQHTVYFSVDHADTKNVPSDWVRRLVAKISAAGLETVIQSLAFELTVLYQAWIDMEGQEQNGYEGFLPACLDTKFEASYVDENDSLGLKHLSKKWLDYTQQTYDETTTLRGPKGTLQRGGRHLRFETLDDGAEVEVRQYKMNELTGEQVLGYGCDDTICTAALHNFFRLFMELEHTWEVYKEVEIDAAYMSAVGFLQGTNFSLAKMRELEKEDDDTYEQAWGVFRSYLLSKGWDGSVCPTFNHESKAAGWKLAYAIVTGEELETQVRLPERMASAMEEKAPILAELLRNAAFKSQWEPFDRYVKEHFKGEPVFNLNSPKQKQHLLYEVLKLPIEIRKQPTDKMRAAGVEGNPSTDVTAVDWAIKFHAQGEDRRALAALKLMSMVTTRRQLYYAKYPAFMHWMTGLLHSQFKQCHANTRRSSEEMPNKQQHPKHPKIEMEQLLELVAEIGWDQKTTAKKVKPRFREVIVPHHKDAVIVSLDEASQELRIIADYSQDPNMVSCYVGEHKKDLHSLTGLGIAQRKHKQLAEWTYELFDLAAKTAGHALNVIAKVCRALGKKTNFTTEYGAMEEKVAHTLLVPVEDAKTFMAAREAMFPVAAKWKTEVIDEAKRFGCVRTKAGAVRHLREAFTAGGYEASKAERQAVNFKVQGSAAEQTKLAYGEAWRRRLAFKYDAVFIGPVHDEVLWSVAIKDLVNWLQEMHACMVRPYGGMTIPIVSSISFGPSFGEQIEIGEEPTVEAVLRGIETMKQEYPHMAANCDRWLGELRAAAA